MRKQPPGRADEGFDSNRHRIQSSHDLLMPFPTNLLTMWPISTKVNYPRNDAADILDRVELFPTDLFSMERSRGGGRHMATKLSEGDTTSPCKARSRPSMMTAQ